MIPFTVSSKRIKYLGIDFTKEVKGFNNKSYETFLKEIKENTNKSKDTLYSWIGKLNIKTAILAKVIYIFNRVLSKFQWLFIE